MKNLIHFTLLFFVLNTLCGQSFSEYERKFDNLAHILEKSFRYEMIDSRLAILDTEDHELFGIDFSHYTGIIDWQIVGLDSSAARPRFIIMRSTMGEDTIDNHYEEHLVMASVHGFVVGSYHYFRAHEGGRAQAMNYLANTRFDCFDIIPVVDIEYKRKSLSADVMRRELLVCLQVIEEHIGVKPMLYSNLNFYKEYLRGYAQFDEYPLWIAAYSEKRRDEVMAFADMFQYTDKHIMKGIQYPVDANLIKTESLKKILMGL